MVLSVEHSSPDRRAQVRDSTDRGNTAMHAEGTLYMQNPSWVQCPLSSHSKLCLWGCKSGEAIPSMEDLNCDAMFSDLIRDEPQTVRKSPLFCSSPTLNPLYQPTYLLSLKEHYMSFSYAERVFHV